MYTDGVESAAGGRVGYGLSSDDLSYLEGNTTFGEILGEPRDLFVFSIELNEGFYIESIEYDGFLVINFDKMMELINSDDSYYGNPKKEKPRQTQGDVYTISYPSLGMIDDNILPSTEATFEIKFYFVTDPDYVSDKIWQYYAADSFANETDVDGSSEEQAYEIGSAQQLALLAKRVNNEKTNAEWADKFYKLTDDVFLASHLWTPIGSAQLPFSGNFDGCGHAIYGLNIDSTDSNQGLFGYAQNASLENIILKDGLISSYDDGSGGMLPSNRQIGSVVGCLKNSSITNCQSNIVIKSDGNMVGGLVGNARGQTDEVLLSNCLYYGSVSGNSEVGGLVGTFTGDDMGMSPILKNCSVDCTASADYYLGALVGSNNNGKLSNCIARGTIASNDGCQVLVGSNRGSVTACYFYGTASQSDLTLPSDATACWAFVNNKIITSGEVDSSWTDYWAVLPGLNGGLPVQKELFWSAGVASSTAEDIKKSLGLS